MLTKTSVFDLKYFRYTIKKMFPYALVMALVLVLSSFIFFGFGEPQRVSITMKYYDTIILGITSNVGMYIIPIVLSIGMFGFLHQKNSTDFIFGSPVKRSALFLTNVIAGAIIMAATLLLNTIFVAIIVSGAAEENNIYVTAQNYILSFFYNLAGYILVFVIASLSATLTGTAVAQLILTIVMTLLPAFLLCFIQLPLVIQYGGYAFPTVTYSIALNSVQLIPDIASAPLTMLFMAVANGVGDFYGTTAYFTNVRAICFTLLVAIIYCIVGVFIFNKYKAENSSKSFINKGIGTFTYIGVFAPIMLFVFFLFAESTGYDDMITSAWFYIFTLLIWIAFVVASLIFNKGFSGFGKQMKLFFMLMIITCTVSGVLNDIGEKSEKEFSFRNEEIRSITVYMQPLNTSPVSGQNVKETYIKVKITDPEMLNLLSDKEVGDSFYYTVICENGKKLTFESPLSYSFTEALYDYIDENQDIKKSLFLYSGAENVIGASLKVLTYNEYLRSDSFAVSDMETITKIVAEKELEYLDIPVRELYYGSDNIKYINTDSTSFGIEYAVAIYPDTSTTDDNSPVNGLLGTNSISMQLSALRYCDGQYFISDYNIEYDSEMFSNFVEDIHGKTAKAVKDLVDFEDAFSVEIAGTFEIDEEQYLNLNGIISSLPSIMHDEFIDVVNQAIKEPFVPDNTIAIYIETDDERNLVFMNIDRDLKPLIEQYFDTATAALKTSQSNLYIGLSSLINGNLSYTNVFFPKDVFDISIKELANMLIDNKDIIEPMITQTVSCETIEDEYYFITFSSSPYYTNAFKFCIPITAEILQNISDNFDYFKEKEEFFDCNNINYIDYEDTKRITDRDDIEYLTSLVKYSYFASEMEDMMNSNSYYEDHSSQYYAFYDMRFVTQSGQTDYIRIPKTDRVAAILFEGD